MSIDERDIRMVVVAFEDARTWCETLADMAERLVEAALARRPLPEAELKAAISQLAETRRFLQSNEDDVARIKHRVGIV